MPHVDIGGLRLFYETVGEAGTPVVLVMGLGMPGRAWGLQVGALAATHRVLFFDHRGVGRSDVPEGVYHIEDMAADVLGLIDHLGFRRVHLAGISMGSMVALEVALTARERGQYRDRIRSLALLSGTAGGGLWWFPPTREALRYSPRVFFGRGVVRYEALLHQLLSPEGFRRVDREALRPLMEEHMPEFVAPAAILGQLAAAFLYDARDRLGHLAGLPTLIVQPGQDILIPPIESEKLAAGIPGARLLSLPDCGHGIPLEYPEETSRLLLAHFRRAEEKGAGDQGGEGNPRVVSPRGVR